MSESQSPRVAIVDYGMGNLFSVRQACESAGLEAVITSSPRDLLDADGVVLPGVGAFGDAMAALDKLDLVSALREVASSSTPFLGICLGMQLLFTESHEFGRHQGLGIVEGEVKQLKVSSDQHRALKVPQVGWNQISAAGQQRNGSAGNQPWQGSLLQGVPDGEFMYFVHSYYPEPTDGGVTTSTTQYGDNHFSSSLRKGSVFACQFHPERSGPQGMKIYQNLARLLATAEGAASKWQSN